MHESILSQGVTLLTYGMGTVFFFLAILIVTTNLVSQFMLRFFPEVEEVKPAKSGAARKSPSRSVDGTTLKVIQAAIDQHRKKQGRS